MPNSKSRRLTEFNARTQMREFEDAAGDLRGDAEEPVAQPKAAGAAAEPKSGRGTSDEERPA